jgi:peptidoglycan-associated lipoprotein
MNTTTRVLLAASICIAMAACSKKVKEEAPVADTTAPATTAPVSDGRFTPADLETNECLRQRTVLFDFDQYVVRPEFQAIVACHAKYLTDRPEARVTLEGHTDERGSREYNMGLGERRSNAFSSALQGAGASATQLTGVSYGEERPVCSESTEECWARNRRVEIIYTAK